ncbi:pentatricopeptide repeat-containing protein At5g39980, chloroplastic isoform X2 [Dioscorea cayenensis subsp. rotundata]|uniref:Pentatricopeptide repeat-containing protein At5g39980, chloroplastic isoform X2 n=1 Tax=Dioscorea cayennensis subsp. rotundata TaxID=55577 RepID=A0AB40D3Y1_DIOCR|nr:pentatricopeptide repeat-containing protein At5g39980, chloroplastic isoform X2 [Dioscorea cayenensis subsp. rotundata]
MAALAASIPSPHSSPSLPLKQRLSAISATTKLAIPPPSSSSSFPSKQVWRNPNLSRHQHHRYIDRSINMDELLSLLSRTTTAEELHAVMSPYAGGGRTPLLSLRFMVSLLSREPDWRRSVALLDWMLGPAGYSPSVFAYNVALRNALRARQWSFASGLVLEMRSHHSLSPDRVTYSTLISYLARAGLLDAALLWLRRMDADRVSPDLVLHTTLIELALKLNDHSKAVSIASRLLGSSSPLDLVAFNSIIHAFSRAGLLREAQQLLVEMRENHQVPPDTVTYSTILCALVARGRYLEALSLFSEMRDRRVPLDLMTVNIMIDAYGQLDMAREADRLFWSVRKLGLEPSIVTYNTMLRVYGDAELFGEAIHLFRLMQRKEIQQNVVTYNTMIKIYGKSLEHEKAGNLMQEMQLKEIQPNAITYSTIISIWARAGKLERAAKLFQKLRSSGAEIDPVLYQTMIVAYERAGLVGHAKRLLHELKHPEGIAKETAVAILANAGRVEEATWVFRQAAEAGEVKDITVFKCMMDLYSRNRRHVNVIEVFEKMRAAGFFPDSEVIAVVLNAYGKLQEFDKADAVYKEMEEEGCIFSDKVHFQMLSLLGMKRDFSRVESLLEKLSADPNIDKKELNLVAASVYERANKLDEASRFVSQIRKRASSNPLALDLELYSSV